VIGPRVRADLNLVRTAIVLVINKETVNALGAEFGERDFLGGD
jgi:hypothetical protein